jgi:hypothetical protein
VFLIKWKSPCKYYLTPKDANSGFAEEELRMVLEVEIVESLENGCEIESWFSSHPDQKARQQLFWAE